MPGKAIRRRWALDLHGFRREGSKETGFRYRTNDGAPITDEKTLARIRRLRIPPAWRDVRIARGESSPLQAVGLDRKGRTQYRYHARFRAHREQEKFRRVVEFGESLPRLRNRVRADLKRPALDRERVLAAIVRLIDQGFFRVGNEKSARSESTYGLTTIRGKHVKVGRDVLLFDYIGKWRKAHQRAVRDAEVAAIVRDLQGLRQKELFVFFDGTRIRDVKDRHVNDYIQTVIGNGFTAKDFRTWAGTLLCSIALGMQGQAPSRTERKRNIKRAVQATAEQLGNTPAVCRSSYICPRLLDEYMEGKSFELLRKRRRGAPVVRAGLSMEERSLLKFLRETIADRRRRPRAA
ncbi:MAG TPA: DNA topoisomerase IB [Thermoanaerobaculia bacterium]|nr:DNA topoisomerase IB [Thermoanaerobaculia bacterium]